MSTLIRADFGARAARPAPSLAILGWEDGQQVFLGTLPAVVGVRLLLPWPGDDWRPGRHAAGVLTRWPARRVFTASGMARPWPGFGVAGAVPVGEARRVGWPTLPGSTVGGVLRHEDVPEPELIAHPTARDPSTARDFAPMFEGGEIIGWGQPEPEPVSAPEPGRCELVMREVFRGLHALHDSPAALDLLAAVAGDLARTGTVSPRTLARLGEHNREPARPGAVLAFRAGGAS